MSQFVSTHALERSVRAINDERIRLANQAANNSYDALQPLTTRYQVPIWGIARSSITWARFKLAFDVQFVFAPEQQDDPYDVPHFMFGAAVAGVPYPNELSPDPSNPDSLVAVHAQVVNWARTRRTDTVVGAEIGFGVSTGGDPATTGQVKFSGHMHLGFSGYGAVIEDPTGGQDVWSGS